MKPYYKILKIKEDATLEEVKQSYRKLSKMWHPDKHEGKTTQKKAEELFKQISEAYSVLSDPEKRKDYDETGFIGNGSIEDNAKTQLIELFKHAIEFCLYEHNNMNEMFTIANRSIHKVILAYKDKLSSSKRDLSHYRDDLKRVSTLQKKSTGSIYQSAIKRVKNEILEKIDQSQKQIMQFELDLRIDELILDILNSDYPKEGQPEQSETGYGTRRRAMLNDIAESFGVPLERSLFEKFKNTP